MKQTIAARLSEHFTAMHPGAVPAQTRHAVKRLLLDYLGVAIAGSRSESGRIATRYARAIGGKPQASLIASGVRVPMETAAFANAICSNSSAMPISPTRSSSACRAALSSQSTRDCRAACRAG